MWLISGVSRHCQILDTVSRHRLIHFYWKLFTRIYNFLLCCFMLLGLQFKITLLQDQKFWEVLWNKLRLKMLVCIYLVFDFLVLFGCCEGWSGLFCQWLPGKPTCSCKLLWLLPERCMVRMIMEMVVIVASPLPLLTANGVGYDASRTASHKDLPWHRFSSTSTPLTCQHCLQNVVIRQRSSNHVCWWRLTNSEMGAKQRMTAVGECLQT